MRWCDLEWFCSVRLKPDATASATQQLVVPPTPRGAAVGHELVDRLDRGRAVVAGDRFGQGHAAEERADDHALVRARQLLHVVHEARKAAVAEQIVLDIRHVEGRYLLPAPGDFL